MTLDVFERRLRNQKLTCAQCRKPEEVVAWLGAVQSQDYPGAKWAVGQRARGITDEAVEEAFNAGRILRTHVMRPTWHFVTPADIRWMLSLTAPRVHARSAPYYRKLQLDARTFARSRAVLERALRDGKAFTREEISILLKGAGIAATGERLANVMMALELDQVVCSGPRRGKQFTYALLEERAPKATILEREAALAELTRRYFQSHGPATVRDFVWWSGLTASDAKAGLASIKDTVGWETINDRTYWFVPSRAAAPPTSPFLFLLPNYDEYLIAYKDRDGIVDLARKSGTSPPPFDPFRYHLVINGRVTGSWSTAPKKGTVLIKTTSYRPLTRAETRALAEAAARHGSFLEMTVDLARPQPIATRA
jgi:hypothetical protein